MSLLMIRKPHDMTDIMNRNTETLINNFMTHTISYSIAEMFKRLMQPYHGGSKLCIYVFRDFNIENEF